MDFGFCEKKKVVNIQKGEKEVQEKAVQKRLYA